MFPNDLSATACAADRNPKAFDQLPRNIIEGGKASYQDECQELIITRVVCIENRPIKLLQFLQRRWPAEVSGQFLKADGTPEWESITVAGLFQGGDHTALIGTLNGEAWVMCFVAPKDSGKRLQAQAACYGNESATPKGLYFAFNHHPDPNGCASERQFDDLKASGWVPVARLWR